MIFFKQLCLVMLGGALGSGMRYGVFYSFQQLTRSVKFPYATFTVNVVGSFLITFISTVAMAPGPMITPNTRLFLTAGIMGGLTTYSSFNHDLVEFLRRDDYSSFALNACATFVTCLIAGLLGLWAAGRALPSAH
jgi:CrcB protein